MSTYGPRTQRFHSFLREAGVSVHRREEAGLRLPTHMSPLPSFNEMIDHHSVTAQEPIVPTLQGIQSYHMSKGWSDAAYSAGVRNLDGSCWLLRGMDNQSGGTGWPEDGRSLCFVAIGNFSEQQPSDALLRTYSVIRAWCISEGAGVNKGDRDYNATGCPGDFLYPHIPHPIWKPTPAPEPLPPKETDMAFLAKNKSNGAIALIDAGNFTAVDPADLAEMEKKFGPPVQLESKGFNRLQSNETD